MGQQQLILVVLSVIVVGIAVVMGIDMFNSGAEAANIDAVVNDLVNMGARAQQYYVKPAEMGGGGRTFTGITIDDIGVASNDNGTYEITDTQAQQITITGTPAIAGGTVVCTVGPDSISTTVNH
jgi:hypothetical protein